MPRRRGRGDAATTRTFKSRPSHHPRYGSRTASTRRSSSRRKSGARTPTRSRSATWTRRAAASRGASTASAALGAPTSARSTAAARPRRSATRSRSPRSRTAWQERAAPSRRAARRATSKRPRISRGPSRAASSGGAATEWRSCSLVLRGRRCKNHRIRLAERVVSPSSSRRYAGAVAAADVHGPLWTRKRRKVVHRARDLRLVESFEDAADAAPDTAPDAYADGAVTKPGRGDAAYADDDGSWATSCSRAPRGQTGLARGLVVYDAGPRDRTPASPAAPGR